MFLRVLRFFHLARVTDAVTILVNLRRIVQSGAVVTSTANTIPVVIVLLFVGYLRTIVQSILYTRVWLSSLRLGPRESRMDGFLILGKTSRRLSERMPGAQTRQKQLAAH